MMKFYADPEDTVVLISSSGNSTNMVNGARDASGTGLGLIKLSGFGYDNALKEYRGVRPWCNSGEHDVVETTHQVWLLAMIDFFCARERA